MWRKLIVYDDNINYLILFINGFIVFIHDWNIHKAWVPFMSSYIFPHPHHLYIGLMIMCFSLFMYMGKVYNESI